MKTLTGFGGFPKATKRRTSLEKCVAMMEMAMRRAANDMMREDARAMAVREISHWRKIYLQLRLKHAVKLLRKETP